MLKGQVETEEGWINIPDCALEELPFY